MSLTTKHTFALSPVCLNTQETVALLRSTGKLIGRVFFVLSLVLSNYVFSQNPVAGNQSFQVLSEGNFTSTNAHHIHGSLAVGGNLVINSSFVGEANMDNTGLYVFAGDGSVSTGLLVKGSVTWTAGMMKVGNGKYIHIGNSTGSITSNNGGTGFTQVLPTGAAYNSAKRIEASVNQPTNVLQTVGFDFTTLFNNYRSTSTTLSTQTNNVQLYNSSNSPIIGNTVSSAQNIRINSLNSGVNYLNLTSASLSNITELAFTTAAVPSANKILVINVPITANFVWNNSNMIGIDGTQGPYVIWNFYGATTYNLTINTASMVVGTVFSPNMNLIKAGTGDIEGGLIAKTMQLGVGEIHNFQFVSDLTTFETCSGNSYDTGGNLTEYADNQDYTVTYTASVGNSIKLTFNSFSTEAGYDYLYIYDGPNTSSTLLYSLNGTTFPPSVTSTGRTLTLRFVSDVGLTSSGWDATISCVPPPCVCTGNLLTNNSFEDGITGWSSSGGSAYNATGYEVCGTYNGYLQATTTNAWLWQQLSATAGTTYYMSFWGGTHDPTFNHFVRLGFYNSSYTLIGSNQVSVDYDVDPNNDIAFYSFSAIAPAGTSYMRVEAFANGDYIKLDQMCLSTNNIGASTTCTAPTVTANSNSPVNAGGTINLTSASSGGGGAQLVTNGDFSGGNNSFSSDYTFGGGYNITTNPQTVWSWAVNCPNPNGNLMIGDGNGNASSRFWYQSINVTAGTTYTLAFNAYDFWGGTTAAKLQWGINGTKIGTVLNLSTGECNTWQQLTTTWTATTTGTVVFAIYNNEISGASNDFAIDDVSIRASGPITYSWAGPNGFTSTSQNPSISNVTAVRSGVYTVTAMVSGASTCPATATVNVVVNGGCTPPNITATSNTPVCIGSTIHFETQSTTPGVTYSWTGPNGFTSTNEQYPCVNNAQTINGGTYTAMTTLNGCTATATVNVVITNTPAPPPPTVPNIYKCAAGTATFTASNCVGTVNWFSADWNYLGSGSTFTTPSLSQNTEYLVECQTATCLSEKGSTYVIFQTTPTTSLSANNSNVCSGQSVSLTASSNCASVSPNLLVNGGFEGVSASPWWLSAPTITTVNNNARTGTYSLSVIGNDVGFGHKIANLSPNTTYTFTGYMKASIAGQNAYLQASGYSGGTGWTQSTITSVGTTYTQFTLTFTTGASDTSVDLGVWRYGTGTVYVDDLVLTQNTPTCTFSWNPGGATTSSITVNPTATTTYTVTSGLNGCTTTASTTVTVSGSAITVNSPTICSGQSTTLTATGCTGTVSWSNGVTAASITVSPASTTTYTATCTPTAVNLLGNPNFETGALGAWGNWGNSTITSVSTERQNGTFGMKTDATSTAGGFGQDIAAVAGETFTVTSWGRVNNTTPWSSTGIKFLNSSWVQVGSITETEINATTFQQYTLTATAPAGTAWVEVYGWSNAGAIMYLDNFVLTKASCAASAVSTVTISSSTPTPTTTGASRCGTGTLILTASGCTGTYNWYATATGGASLGTGASYTTPSISTTTTYYVDCTISACVGGRAAAVATINVVPVTPMATVVSTGCTGATGSITVTNLPDGFSTNINGGAWTQYKNSYVDLAAGTYTIGYQGGGCTSYATFTVTNSTDNPFLSLAKTEPTCSTTGSITATGSGGTTGLGDVTYQLWYGITGNLVSDLTSNANYPNTPSFSTLVGIAEGYENAMDNVGGRISGYIVPPTTGTYYFWLASDDYSELWGSGDANPANKTLLASVVGFTGYREWNKYASQKTAAVSLNAGQIYYFEVLYKEGTGGDNISLGWAKPGEATTAPSEVIPGKYLRPNIASSTITPIYQYKIGSGAFQTSNVFSGLTAGTYTVTIQDAGGCTTTASVTLSTTGATAPTTPGASRCGTGTVTLSASGCTGTYNWFNVASGGTSLGTAATYTTPSISATTTYYVSCTIGSCVSSRTPSVATVTTAATATASSNAPVCVGSAINLSSTGGTTYLWNGPNSFSSTVQNPSLVASATTSGIYTVTVTATGGCTVTATTNVANPNITISNIVVSACINQPLQDVATVSMSITWANAPSGDRIKVVINNKTEYIDVAAGATSPQTLTFIVPANGISNIPISAGWVTYQSGNCNTLASFNAPAACSVDNLNCEKILYLCGPDKPADGDAWDHGFMNYLTGQGATVTPTYTKPDASGYGLYNPLSITTLMNINLNDYTSIIISPTTESNLAVNLLTALKGYSGGILMMNYTEADDLGLTSTPASYSWQDIAYTNNTNTIKIYNYDNINPTYGNVVTIGNYLASADAYLWSGANNMSSATNGIYFYYTPTDAMAGVPATHGARVYLGYHMNGIYSNAQNGGVMPAPSSSYFLPTNHLTLEAKAYFDQAIKNITTGLYVQATGDTKCAGSTINLTSTGGGIVSYSWAGPSSFTSTLQNPIRSSSTTAMSGIYTVTVTGAGGCTATATANVIVNAIPTAPTSAGVSRCGIGTVTLSASGCAGGTISWYGALTGGTALTTGATYTTPSITTTTIYYVECSLNGCISTTRNSTVATVSAIPTASATGDVECVGSTISLLSSGGNTYLWSGPSSFSSTLQNPTISSATTTMAGIYTVTVTGMGGCTATATANVIVNATPTAPISAGASRCGIGTVTLSASGCAGGTISWYGALTGGTALTTGPTYTTPSITVTTIYYVECNLNGCISTTRNSAVATVNSIPTATATSNSSIIGGTLNLYATGGTTYLWTGPNGFSSTLKDVSTAPVTASMIGVYSVTVSVSGCTATATTNLTMLTTDPGQIDCSLIPILSFTNPTLITGTAGAVNAQYRFSNVTGGTDAIVTIMSKSHPDIDIIDIDIPVSTYGGYEAAMQPIIDYNWINGGGSFDAAGEKSVTFKIDFVETGTTTPKVMPNFIASGIDIDGSGSEVREFIESSGYQSHEIQTPTSLTLSGGLKAKGSYAAYTGINELALDAVISYGYVGKSSITITYGAEWNGNTSDFIDNVNPTLSDERRLNSLYFKCYDLNTTVCDLPLTAPTGVPANRCGTGTVTLSATGCSGTYNWYAAATGGTAIGTSGSYITPSISVNTTYYVECNAVGCTSTRTAVLATVNAIPIAPTVSSNSICGSGSITLTATGCTGGTISWFTSKMGGTSLGTGTNYTVSVLTSSAVYFAACTSSSSACVSDTRNYGVATVNSIPEATLTGVGSLCLGYQPTNSGKLIVTKFKSTDTFSYNIGSTYNSGTASAFAVIPANGEVLTGIADPSSSITYTVRIKNVENCIIDRVVTLTNQCSTCPAGYCEPSVVVKTK